MSFVFDRRDNFAKSVDISGANASHDGPLQIRQVPADATCQFSTFRSQRYQKSAPVCFPDFARNQTTLFEAVEDACQCRSFVGEPAMEIGHSCRRGMRKQR